MWNLGRVLGAIVVITGGFVGGFNFGWKGILLVFAASLGGFLWCSSNYVEYEDDEPEHDSCYGCKHNLGGGHCKINLEGECGEGNHELWESEDGL